MAAGAGLQRLAAVPSCWTVRLLAAGPAGGRRGGAERACRRGRLARVQAPANPSPAWSGCAAGRCGLGLEGAGRRGGLWRLLSLPCCGHAAAPPNMRSAFIGRLRRAWARSQQPAPLEALPSTRPRGPSAAANSPTPTHSSDSRLEHRRPTGRPAPAWHPCYRPCARQQPRSRPAASTRRGQTANGLRCRLPRAPAVARRQRQPTQQRPGRQPWPTACPGPPPARQQRLAVAAPAGASPPMMASSTLRRPTRPAGLAG